MPYLLLLNLNIYAVEGGTHTETTECIILRGRLQHHELLEKMGTETISALIDILIIEIVVGCFAQYRRTVRVTLSLSDVARRIAHLEMQFILACSTEFYVAAHH